MTLTKPANQFGVRDLEDLPDLAGKAVLVRATLDLPVGGDAGSPVAGLRLARLADTVSALLGRGASVSVCGDTHPPGTGPDPEHDRSVHSILQDIGASSVHTPLGASVEDAAGLDDLVGRHDAFVNDSFQWSYLPLPSLVVPAERLPSAAGRSLERDLLTASSLLHTPQRPFAAVLGGQNSLLRLHGLTGLILRADVILVGGAMSLPMLEAIGKRPHEQLPEWFLEECRAVIGLADRVGHHIHLPLDIVVRRPDGTLDVADPAHAPDGEVVDIGPLTAKRFAELVHGSDTVVWTGALGRVEERPSAAGTLTVARGLDDGATPRVVVGGDSLVALLQSEGVAAGRMEVTSATDSLLELFKNGDLPALVPLRGECRSAAH